MSLLMEKAQKDLDTVSAVWGQWDVCSFHLEQAIEKLLKYSLELKGRECTGTVKELYQQYVASGWQEIDGMVDSVDEISGWILSGYQQITVTQEQLAKAMYFCEVLKRRIFEMLATEDFKI